MGDISWSLVPGKSTFDNKEIKVKKIIKWLISLDIIKQEVSDCILDINKLGYDISIGAKRVVKEPDYLPFDLQSRGLEITNERSIFSTFEGGLDKLICPECIQNIAEEDWDFFNEWASNKSNNITCPKCKTSSEIHSFKFEPIWGFSDLGFTFWNWPEFKSEFILEFEEVLGEKIDLVYAHI
jgi:hypothetical protein